MNEILNKDVQNLVTELITTISEFNESSGHLENVRDFAFCHIASPEYYFNSNRNDIESVVFSLAEKIQFNGFLNQSDAIKKLTKKFFDTTFNKNSLNNRISIIRLLLNLSESPTQHYANNPDLYKPKVFEEEVIDWVSVLNESAIYCTSINFSDSSHEESEADDESSKYSGSDNSFVTSKYLNDTVDDFDFAEKLGDEMRYHIKIKNAKTKLTQTIQSRWWNREYVCIKPKSDCDEATVALRWDQCLNNSDSNINRKNTSIVPEYNIMREIIWEFFVPHTCFSYILDNNQIVPKSNVTISSCRWKSFHAHLKEFVPYFEMLHTFCKFQNDLKVEYFVSATPDTYRSYAEGLQEIIEPVYDAIRSLENDIRSEEKTTTLLIMAKQLRLIFKNVEQLYAIHLEIIENKNTDLGNSFLNTTNLLSYLYYGLLNSSEKDEQNIYFTLYLKSIYKYFTIIEIWLKQDQLDDITDEFLIVDKAFSRTDHRQLEYRVRNLSVLSEFDGMLHIIQTKVLQLAKNIRFLRLIGKLHLLTDKTSTNKESLYNEYINEVLKEAISFSKSEEEATVNTAKTTNEESDKNEENEENLESTTSTTAKKDLIKICPDFKVSDSGFDSINRFLDFSNEFLCTAFDSFLYEQPKMEKKKKTQTLFEIIDKNILNIFPSKQILEKTFLNVLYNRYSVPGLLVKNILLTQFELNKYFSLLKHLYLFQEDIIFPLYKNMFKQFENQQMWGNFFWLTSKLQDIFMDIYPDNYEYMRVDVDPNWKLCTNPIAACELITLHTKIAWPINIIIRNEHIFMYSKVFQFILKIKWALNTLNQLQFSEIEPKNKKQTTKLIKQRIIKLQTMRFFLLNDVSSTQHYILGHLFNVFGKKFETDLENSYDLESIIKSHDYFIRKIFGFCSRLRDENSQNYGFKKILKLVILLQQMWKDIFNIDDDLLKKCEKSYRQCHKFLSPIIEVEVLHF